MGISQTNQCRIVHLTEAKYVSAAEATAQVTWLRERDPR